MMVGLILLSTKREAGVEKLREAHDLSGREARYGAALLRGLSLAGMRITADEGLLRELSRTARTPQELEILSSAMLALGRSSAALHYARKGLKADRSRVGNMFALAAASAHHGDFELAYKLQLQAVNLSGHAEWANRTRRATAMKAWKAHPRSLSGSRLHQRLPPQSPQR